MGFLPGDMIAKVNPYLRPLYDALFDMMDMERATRAIERGDIEIAPLAFMRGRTLNDSFVILDEAQNATAEQMKMFLTRLGFNSKAVVTGDITQVDLPPDRVSGLIEVRDILRHIDGISFVYFDERDVVRHKLVQDIIKAYDQHENAGQLQPRAAQAGRRASPGSHGRPSSSLPSQPKGSSGPTALMPVSLQVHVRTVTVGRRRVLGLAKTVLKLVGEPLADMNLSLVGDRRMRRLNRRFRHKDRSTDVLAFAFREARAPHGFHQGATHLGDVVISLPTAQRQAKAAGRPWKKSL